MATDTNDFPRLRRENCIYVVNTEYVHRLVSQPGSRLFFMSRPRRFGKSLTLSVLKALFSGRRELFDGLFIAEKTDWNWNETYPIIHFEFNDVTTTSLEEYARALENHVKMRLQDAGYVCDEKLSAAENFGATFANGATKTPVSIGGIEYAGGATVTLTVTGDGSELLFANATNVLVEAESALPAGFAGKIRIVNDNAFTVPSRLKTKLVVVDGTKLALETEKRKGTVLVVR